MMNALAEQFKDASTVHRGKDGRRVNIFKDIETKRKELQEKNEANVIFTPLFIRFLIMIKD